MPRSPNINQKVSAVCRVIAGERVGVVADEVGVEVGVLASWTDSFRRGGRSQMQREFPPPSGRRKHAPPDPGLTTMAEALAYAEPMANSTYGRFLSDALAIVLANGLRTKGFAGILPDEHGGFESPARSARGLKKLDVNYSTPEMGLGLGLSIKTIAAPDPTTKRFTKNYSRNDNELRAEAMDYHRRQPYAVLAGFLFLPAAACDDGGLRRRSDEDDGASSFAAAVRYFRHRTPRPSSEGDLDLFEAFFVCIYEPDGSRLRLWPVHHLDLPPPKVGRPKDSTFLTLDEALADCADEFDRRNTPVFEFAEG